MFAWMYVPRFALRLVLGVILLGPASVHAACPPNPTGGPNRLQLVSKPAGTDLDLGWTGKYHDLAVPANSTLDLCLANCNGTNDTLCDASGGSLSVVNTAFGPPAPFIIGKTAVCLSTTFSNPPNGTADVGSGALRITAPLAANAFLPEGPLGDVKATTVICPRCSGASVGATGTCDTTAATSGGACTVDQVVNVARVPPGGNSTYALSRQCLPKPPANGTIALNVVFETKQVSASACAGQTTATGCNPASAASCTPSCTGVVAGLSQTCCQNDSTQACFPATVVRTGSTNVPSPPLPSTVYPKEGPAVLAAVACIPAIGGLVGAFINGQVGLVGPGAMIVPITHTWTGGGPPPPTTTSTSTLPLPTTTSTSSTTLPVVTTTTTTTLPECTAGSPPAGCDATDPCRVPSCPTGTCLYADATDLAAVVCRMDKIAATVAGSSADLFGGPKGQRKVQKAFNAAANKLKALGGASGKKRAKLIKQTTAKVRAFVNVVDKALAKTIDPALRQSLVGLGQGAIDRLGQLTI